MWVVQARVFPPGPERWSDIPQVAQHTCGCPQVGTPQRLQELAVPAGRTGHSASVPHGASASVTMELRPILPAEPVRLVRGQGQPLCTPGQDEGRGLVND